MHFDKEDKCINVGLAKHSTINRNFSRRHGSIKHPSLGEASNIANFFSTEWLKTQAEVLFCPFYKELTISPVLRTGIYDIVENIR